MSGDKAERFVRFNLLLMAGGFALVGFFFIAWPDGTLARLTEFGDNFGDFAPAPMVVASTDLDRSPDGADAGLRKRPGDLDRRIRRHSGRIVEGPPRGGGR